MYKIKRTLGIVSLADRSKKENHREGKMWAVDSGKRGSALPETKMMQTQTSTEARQSLGGTGAQLRRWRLLGNVSVNGLG